MARPAADPGLMPSLLDRFIAPEFVEQELRSYSPAQMMNAVRRDLEDLFNSHAPTTIGPEYDATRASIAGFGLPDLPSLSASGAFVREDVRRIIEVVIARHEPRLRDVRVIFSETPDAEVQHRLRFHIEARLNVDPSPEVEFVTVLELTTGQASIQAGRGA